MAQRLATEYRNVKLSLTYEELTEFIRSFRTNNIHIEEKVLDNGDREYSLLHPMDYFNLIVESQDGKFVVTGDCFFKDRSLAENMRKQMAKFKGEAIVNRIFQSFIIEYRYEFGTIASIRELHGNDKHSIFENHDFSFMLQKIFANNQVESEIAQIRNTVDQLLDKRLILQKNKADQIAIIDQQLNEHAQRLNELEA